MKNRPDFQSLIATASCDHNGNLRMSQLSARTHWSGTPPERTHSVTPRLGSRGWIPLCGPRSKTYGNHQRKMAGRVGMFESVDC